MTTHSYEIFGQVSPQLTHLQALEEQLHVEIVHLSPFQVAKCRVNARHLHLDGVGYCLAVHRAPDPPLNTLLALVKRLEPHHQVSVLSSHRIRLLVVASETQEVITKAHDATGSAIAVLVLEDFGAFIEPSLIIIPVQY